MNECILITTMDGNVHRFNKKFIKDYELFKDEDYVEKLVSNSILVIHTNTRKVSFLIGT
ncbi:hypothetical protein [Clostridium sp. UBA1056]|uniref:hypothetical protein n=1 Tax=unclassified Clostridium TaxID=2614128 RepID=UPI003216979C